MDGCAGRWAGRLLSGGDMMETKGTRRYETRSCPCCGSELYADVGVCYECLYDFSREPLPHVGEAGERQARDVGGPTEETTRLDGRADETGVLLRTPAVDVWTEVGPEGLTVGRSRDNDVVLHSLAVSRRHLRMTPTPDGMEVSDQNARNPARYHGREVRGSVVVEYGDALDLCGTTLVMTGPRPSRPVASCPSRLH